MINLYSCKKFYLTTLLFIKNPEVTLNTYLIMPTYLVNRATEVKVFQWNYNSSQKIL